MFKKLLGKVSGFILLIILIIGIAFGFISFNGQDIKDFGQIFKEDTIDVSSDEELINMKFDKEKYPSYYAKLNNNDLSQNDKNKIKKLQNKDATEAFDYDGLDDLGRSGDAYGIISIKSIEHNRKQGRPSFSSDADPSGWPDKNPKIKTGDYRGYLWNRSHSIAWSLGGSMERENLTTGTRAQNVGTRGHQGGMKYPEEKIMDTVENKHIKVYYKVQPMYKNDELIPRGSKVTMYSIDDDGASLNESAWIFNAQAGVKITYNGMG